MQADTHAFIIRIWHEAVDEAGNIQVLRGTIEYVGHKEQHNITSLKRAFQIIEERLGMSGPSSETFSKNGH